MVRRNHPISIAVEFGIASSLVGLWNGSLCLAEDVDDAGASN